MTRPELLAIGRRLLAAHDLDPSAIPELIGILQRGRVQRIPDGERLCRQGEEADALWVLLRGCVQVQKRNYQGEAQALSQLTAPTLLGHMALIDDTRRSATCTAAGPVEVVTLTREQFVELMDDPGPSGQLFQAMVLTSLWRHLAQGNGVLAKLMNPSPSAAAQ